MSTEHRRHMRRRLARRGANRVYPFRADLTVGLLSRARAGAWRPLPHARNEASANCVHALSMFTVCRPLDYPGQVVVREWLIRGGAAEPLDPPLLFGTLDDARKRLQRRGLTRLERQKGDDPAIVETWL